MAILIGFHSFFLSDSTIGEEGLALSDGGRKEATYTQQHDQESRATNRGTEG